MGHYLHKLNNNLDNSCFLIFSSECIQDSDCPNGGQNYVCNINVCNCKSGFVLDGDSCVGM